jgi:hypothetical protein
MSKNTKDRPTLQPTTTDSSIRTHIVNCPDDKESTEAWVTEARVMGLTVTALCGYQWVPQSDPERHAVCEACVEAARIIIAEEAGA